MNACVRSATLASVLATLACACACATAQDGCTALSVEDALQQVNARRAQGAVCGARGGQAPASPLVWNAQLQAAAQRQARWLADNGALSHTGPGGATLRQRAADVGYSYARIAENVAQGQRSVAQVLDGWTASEGHCVNLYDSSVTEMALACVPGRAARGGRPYWALLLGRPP